MITSTSNQQMKQLLAYQTKAKKRNADGVFLAEGRKMFLEAPADWIRSIYLSETYAGILGCQEMGQAGQEESALAVRQALSELDQAVANRLKTAEYEILSDSLFAKVSDTQTPQGILMIVKQPQRDLKSVLGKNFYLLLEDLQDPGNLGTIIRTAEGAGVDAVILSKGSVSIYSPKVVRATMGSIYRVPFLYVEDLHETMRLLEKEDVNIYAAYLEGSVDYAAPDYRGKTAFLIGNEGNGLRKETASLANQRILIPMEGQLESLNAGIATGVLLYEAHRQRTKADCK